MLRCLVILLVFLAVTIALPAGEKDVNNHNPDDLIDFIRPNSNEISHFKTIEDTKDLLAFFSHLRDMRTKKSLSIVGKDSKYIYLVVKDIQDTPGNYENSFSSEQIENRRSKRGLEKIINLPLDLAGLSAVRNIAVTISLFNYLGYLPMRLPGVPYHIDTGSPDTNTYNYVNHIPYVKEHHF